MGRERKPSNNWHRASDFCISTNRLELLSILKTSADDFDSSVSLFHGGGMGKKPSHAFSEGQL